jgi:hypothetical protein
VRRNGPSDAHNTHITIEAESLGIANLAEAALILAEQELSWERRWQDPQDHLNRLLAPRPGAPSADAIHAAHKDLQAFYVQTYHLKDSLIDASATTGISRQKVESEINNNPDLALLLADLANMAKHGHLSRPPRSGHVPAIVRGRGTTGSSVSASGGWRLDVVIEHLGHELDGLDVAKCAIATWEQALKRWNLL